MTKALKIVAGTQQKASALRAQVEQRRGQMRERFEQRRGQEQARRRTGTDFALRSSSQCKSSFLESSYDVQQIESVEST